MRRNDEREERRGEERPPNPMVVTDIRAKYGPSPGRKSGEEGMENITLNIQQLEINLYFKEDVIVVNQNFPLTLFNLIPFVTTNLTVFVVNLLVLLWLKIKENNLVDRMVALDCIVNMAVVIVLFLAFPYRIWYSTIICYGISFFRCFVLTMNR